MQSRFGLKDFVLLLAIIAVGVIGILGWRQNDRVWEKTLVLTDKVNQVAAAQREQPASGGRGAEAVERLSGEQARQNQAVLAEVARLSSRVEALAGAPRVGAPLGEATKPPSPPPATVGGPAPEVTAAPATVADQHDESWARPGVPVTRAEPLHLARPPQAMDGYAPGGTFVEVFEGQPRTLTPYRYADVYGQRVVDQVCESLGAYDPQTLKMEGVLADAWQYDPDGMWLRVHINPRAVFSDGTPVTAEDARWTYQDFLYNPEIEADRFRGTYTAVDKIEVLSDRALEYTFKEKRFDSFDQVFGYPIIPKHFYSQFTPRQINEGAGLVMGSGPYRLERLDPSNQWAPPQDVVLVRNERFWGPPPSMDRLRYRTIQDSLARLTDYTNGKSDMIRPSTDQFRLKVDEPGFTNTTHALNWVNMRSGYSFIAWQCGERNGKLRPFHDRRVRMAMTHLIDRQRVSRDIYKNLYTIATGPFSPSTEQADPDIKPWPYDVDKAKQLLEEAGWKDRDNDGILENEQGERFEFEFVFATGSESTERLVAYIKDQCASVGIKCTPRPTDWSIFQTLLQNRDFDAITFAWSQSAPESDPNQIWHSSQIQNQGDNFIQWNSPEADRLIEAGRRETDHDKRMLVWHELHRLFHEEQPYTFMLNLSWLRFVNTRIENVNTYKTGIEQREMFIKTPNQGLLN
ncbi:MAG: hypothetical protein IT437_01195 [Phycisphaerales bacterium]|nr:hypothetical protein [Phycisphaerales bacterium]